MIKFNTRFNEKTFNLKWYKNDIPTQGDIVICRVMKIDDCVKVSILDYGGIEGTIHSHEISRKKIKSIRSIMKVGEIKPFRVHNIYKRQDVSSTIDIDLSNKNVGDADDIDTIEKYYRLISIMHIWLKNIANSTNQLYGKIVDLTESVELIANINKNPSINHISTIHNSVSVSILAYDDTVADAGAGALVPTTTKSDTDSETESDDVAISNTTELDLSGATENKSIPYSQDIWNKVMSLTLWKDLDDVDYDIYDLFMNIKTKKSTSGKTPISESFPELIEAVSKSEIVVNHSVVDDSDIENLVILIDRFINYNICLKVQLKLTSWSLNSLDQIKEIIANILNIPSKSYPDANLSFKSVVLNSPNYDFVIKSPNKFVMDELYSIGSTVDESKLGNLLHTVLKSYADIHYEINIEREDLQ